MKKKMRAGEPVYHHGDLRRAIMDAALKTIEESGAHSLSLREIARKIGVTTAAPYHHFKDREALLIEIALQGYAQLLQCLEFARDRAVDGCQEIEGETRAYLSFAREHPALYSVMFSVEVANKVHYPEMRAMADRCFQVVCSSVVKCARSGARESAEAALCLWATLHGISALNPNQFLEEGRGEQDRIAVKAARSIVLGYA